MNLARFIPLAFVMIAGPQMLSAIFLATTEKWRSNSAAFVGGAAVSITLVVSIAYFAGSAVSVDGDSDTLYIVILVLLVAAAAHVFITRKTAKPPKWMGKLENASPLLSFRLGFLLLGIFPTDILTSWAVGVSLANQGEPWWHYLSFLLFTLLFLALPAIDLLLFGERGEAFLPKVRDWMNANSWIVSEIVIALFIVITANSLAG